MYAAYTSISLSTASSPAGLSVKQSLHSKKAYEITDVSVTVSLLLGDSGSVTAPSGSTSSEYRTVLLS